ncbi:Lactate utilization protein B [Pseudobythopirellula maris]|uniref:Lactate utilization protein B n=1 Tax=Pseudobythopirellula maris TaxID=2527991 RepID=A0A5C5ZIG5_9BACT|nr:LutB/LldF family L-lactate oxidation iron-sulfur protein [Pseudobythopirellula maris]TWT87172.1 Lactate utilization protein B [Pseudobythopirellula maris]
MSVNTVQFQTDADRMQQDGDRREFLRTALNGYILTRSGQQSKYGDYEAARTTAAAIKWQAIENLGEHLERFADNLEARGVHVHWCSDAAEARAAIVGVLKKHDAKAIVKSKCMTTEEIHLNELLEKQGYDVVESDLGEYIVQLRREAPYHFVFPAMHLKRGEIRELFERELGDAPTDDPEALTMIARQALRQKYLAADVGISGANFGVAETGMISITENEGNARLTTAMPKVHIALMGIEKVIPRFADLAVMLPMLALAGTGQRLTGYNSQFAGPRQEGECDGPEEMHVVLLDNHRTELLAHPEERDALRCIRCGACLNVCPVFKNVGGHTYGTTYQGPIGSVITPHLRGMKDWKHLSNASSLCGACTETCPVRIDLHHHLLRNRHSAAESSGGWAERMQMRGFALVMRQPWLYGIASSLGRWAHTLSRPIHGTRLDPVYAWRKTRDFPAPAPKTFQQLWRERKKDQPPRH